MIIFKRKKFTKSYENLSRKLQNKVDHVIIVFQDNPFDPILRNHKLQGDLSNFSSIDVTGDIRIIFFCVEKNTYEMVELIDLGSHSQLY